MRTFQTVLNRIAPVAVWALLGAGCADDGAAGGASPGAGAPVTGRGAAAADAAENPATGGVADSAALDAEIEALEQRVAALRDIAAIEKLQRTYGYYLDEADWDNLIDLFADGAIAEYGASGVYVGKDSIREFLYALGGGRSGLEPGVLNEHVQLQPVIDVAPDGLTAKARWRALGLLGRYESYATWQDGPYENEYRKEDGRWKISRIRWIERFTVPFDGGLAASEAASQEPAELPPPDRPSTIEDEPWPAVSTLPYHFPNPVTGAVTSPGDAGTASAANADAANADPANADAASTDADGTNADGTNADGTNADGANPGSTNADTAEAAPAGLAQGAPQPDTLDARAAALARDVERLEDEREIEILQRTYGYFVDKNLWREIADLFTEDGTLEIGGRGVFVGRDRALEYLEWLGEPEHGRLYDHTQMQGVVHVSPDGQTAKGRWRALVFGGNEGGISVFGDCIYENEYRKEDGVWKLSKLHSYFIMYTNWDQGWAKLGWPNTRPEEELPPDRPPTVVYDMYPGELTAPMHYENPVTGGPVFAEAAGAAAAQPPAGATDPSVGAEPSGDRRASAPPAPIDIRAGLESLRRRIGLLEDAKAVERLHNVYGYYLDDRRWDELADLFADDGTLEMGQRGVYAGKARVRASLDLLGPAGPRDGLIESHYQYQPVVHVAPDGQSAELRAREFVLSGEHGGAAYVGGSVYENEYVKEDGVWKIASSHPYTTFLADYTRGWSHGALPMPGPSDALPPDRPPSVEYEAFPAFNLLPPFHYDHPVTGRPIAR